MRVFSLRLEVLPAPFLPTHHLQELVDIANRLQIPVECEMNGVSVLAEPGCDVDRLMAVYEECRKRKRLFCHAQMQLQKEVDP